GLPSSTTIDQEVPFASTSPTNQEIQSQVTHQGAEEQIHGHQNAQFDNAPILHNFSSDPSSEETTLQGFIPSNLHHLNQSFDTLIKLTNNHPLENVIGDLSRSVLTRSQLQRHAIWCYFDANDNSIPLAGNGVVEIYYLKGRIMVDYLKSPTHYPCDIAKTFEEYESIHSEDGYPARANIKQALGRDLYAAVLVHHQEYKKNPFYKFSLANKKFSVDVEIFREILDIYPRVSNEDFIAPPFKEDLLTFLIELGYKDPLDHLARMENVDYPELIWEDFQYQIDYRQSKLRRRKIMPYPRFTKIVINHYISLNLSIPKGPSSSFHTIKDDGVISRLKFVRIGKEFQEYGLAILETMSQPHAGGSSEGTVITPGVPDESTYTLNLNINIKDTDNDEKTNDEYIRDDEYVHGNVDKEMKDAEVAETGKDDEVTDAAKAYAKKKELTKDDQAKDDSGTIKDYANTKINSVLDIQIQQEFPQIHVAPTATTVPDPLLAIARRVSILEKDIKELKQIDHYAEIHE
nr:hypothetical protein [Tanacetum cinerariifolium]